MEEVCYNSKKNCRAPRLGLDMHPIDQWAGYKWVRWVRNACITSAFFLIRKRLWFCFTASWQRKTAWRDTAWEGCIINMISRRKSASPDTTKEDCVVSVCDTRKEDCIVSACDTAEEDCMISVCDSTKEDCVMSVCDTTKEDCIMSVCDTAEEDCIMWHYTGSLVLWHLWGRLCYVVPQRKIVLCDATEKIYDSIMWHHWGNLCYVKLQRQGALCKTTGKLCYMTPQRKTCHTGKEDITLQRKNAFCDTTWQDCVLV